MSDYYTVLGVQKNATDDEIKKAYRKLASKFHPDKVTDEAEKTKVEAEFKKVKEAFEAIETAEKRAKLERGDSGWHQHTGDMSDILRAMRAANEHARQNATPFIRLQVDLVKAFHGDKIPLNINGRSIGYNLRAGLPPGVTFMDEVPYDDGTKVVQVQLLIDAGNFIFKHTGSADGISFSGDLEGIIEVDVLDMLLGAWIKTKDFLGKEMQVRVPAGFEPQQRLKVAGHGYSNWVGDKAGSRGDLFLRVKPIFKPAEKLDPVKVEMLYNATRPTTEV